LFQFLVWEDPAIVRQAAQWRKNEMMMIMSLTHPDKTQVSDLALNAGAILRRRCILRLVANKPFSTNYRIPSAGGYVVINGEQIVKIMVTRAATNPFLAGEAWMVTFFLSDGSTHEIAPSLWTKNFVQDVFGDAPGL
jgi:hypothetical protein